MADGTPATFERSRIVELSDGETVTVKKWSYVRALEMMKFLGDSWKELLTARAAMAAASNLEEAISSTLKFLGPKALQMVRLSVDKPEVVHEDIDLEDMLELLQATLELNLTERMVKKAKALLGKLKSFLPAEGLLAIS